MRANPSPSYAPAEWTGAIPLNARTGKGALTFRLLSGEWIELELQKADLMGLAKTVAALLAAHEMGDAHRIEQGGPRPVCDTPIKAGAPVIRWLPDHAVEFVHFGDGKFVGVGAYEVKRSPTQ